MELPTQTPHLETAPKSFGQKHIPNSIAGRVVSTLSEYNEIVVYCNKHNTTGIQQHVEWVLKERKKKFQKQKARKHHFLESSAVQARTAVRRGPRSL